MFGADGNYVCLDLTPPENEIPGQVVEITHEEERNSKRKVGGHIENIEK